MATPKNIRAALHHEAIPGVLLIIAILPIFAFANSGVEILGLSPSALVQPVPLGIALGLFAGKQIGVFNAAFIAAKLGVASLPRGLRWGFVFGMAALCGVGFTMSLFIGSLAFEGSGGPDYAVNDRLGILTGSFLSAVVGGIILLLAPKLQRE